VQAQRSPAESFRGGPPEPHGHQANHHQLTERAHEIADHLASEIQREEYPLPGALRRGWVVLTLYLVVLVALLALALAAHSYSVLPGDLPFTRELQEDRNPLVYFVLYFVSYIGYPLQSAVIFIVVAMLLWLFHLRLEAIFLTLTLLGDLIGGALKLLVARSRPSPDLVHVTQQLSSFSFPSGHTLHYTVFYGFLAFVVIMNFRPSWERAILVVICLALVALVGVSRVYLGEHWLTDVIGGYLTGLLLLTPLIAGYLWAREHYDSATLRKLPAP
jgi:undecaprenyl-diphosphatase